MENLKEIYQNLTGVNIEQQQRTWDERGKGYYGEFLLFCQLYKSIEGHAKFLMNLQIPTEGEKATEIDLLMIHESGLYVFEVKHHKGTIYGQDDDQTWTQWFKTSHNEQFRNPVLQNGYHIRALNKLFPEIKTSSFIVFTNEACVLKTENKNPEINICKLEDVPLLLSNKLNEKVLSPENIEEIFNQLSQYSPMQEPVCIDGETAPFSAWIDPILKELRQEKEETKTEKNKLTKSRIFYKIATVCTAAFCIIFAILSVFFTNSMTAKNEQRIQENYNAKIAEFNQKFLHIDEIDNPYIDALQSYIDVSDVSLLPLTDDAVQFTAKLSLKTKEYVIKLSQDAKYIVMMWDGRVFEYDVFDQTTNRYFESENKLTPGYRTTQKLKNAKFYGIQNTTDIKHIKITGVSVCQTDIKNTVIKKNLELQLYN